MLNETPVLVAKMEAISPGCISEATAPQRTAHTPLQKPDTVLGSRSAHEDEVPGIGQSTVPSGPSHAIRTGAIVKIRTLLARAQVKIMLGDLDAAEAFVYEAFRYLDTADDEAIAAKVNLVQFKIQQTRDHQPGHRRNVSDGAKKTHHRPSPLHLQPRRRRSHAGRLSLQDLPTEMLADYDKGTVQNGPDYFDNLSPFAWMQKHIGGDLELRSRANSVPHPGSATTQDETKTSDQDVAQRALGGYSEAPPVSSSGSFEGIDDFQARVQAGLPRKKQPATRLPSGGIDSLYSEEFKDLPYSPNLKLDNDFAPDAPIHVRRWADTSIPPMEFSDPFKGSTPRRSALSYLQSISDGSTSSTVQSPQPEEPWRKSLRSPIARPAHPSPHVTFQTQPFSESRRRSSVSSPTDTSHLNAVRHLSSEDIEPETTDGPALITLLESVQVNPHGESSTVPTSPTERIRQLSVDEMKPTPAKRPLLTLPFNVNAYEKLSASIPSPLRQSFSVDEIDFPSTSRLAGEHVLFGRHIPTTLQDASTSVKRQPSQKKTPKPIVSPRYSQIPQPSPATPKKPTEPAKKWPTVEAPVSATSLPAAITSPNQTSQAPSPSRPSARALAKQFVSQIPRSISGKSSILSPKLSPTSAAFSKSQTKAIPSKTTSKGSTPSTPPPALRSPGSIETWQIYKNIERRRAERQRNPEQLIKPDLEGKAKQGLIKPMQTSQTESAVRHSKDIREEIESYNRLEAERQKRRAAQIDKQKKGEYVPATLSKLERSSRNLGRPGPR